MDLNRIAQRCPVFFWIHLYWVSEGYGTPSGTAVPLLLSHFYAFFIEGFWHFSDSSHFYTEVILKIGYSEVP
jgi:hypothetical protein